MTVIDNHLVDETDDAEWAVYDGDMCELDVFATEEEAQIEATKRAIDEACVDLVGMADGASSLETLRRVLELVNQARALVDAE